MDTKDKIIECLLQRINELQPIQLAAPQQTTEEYSHPLFERDSASPPPLVKATTKEGGLSYLLAVPVSLRRLALEKDCIITLEIKNQFGTNRARFEIASVFEDYIYIAPIKDEYEQ